MSAASIRPFVCAAGVALAGSFGWGVTAREALPSTAGPTPNIVSLDLNPSTGYNYILNTLVGADRFYNAGYYGTNTTIANVEAGHIWNGHETLTNVTSYLNDPSINSAQRQYDFHATMVGFVLGGLGPPAPTGGYYWYQFGMAPTAFLSSVAIASSFSSTDLGSFDVTPASFTYGYRAAMQTGIARPIAPGIYFSRPADVVNSSWGFDDSTGQSQMTRIIDALAYANHQTVCVAAGNHDTVAVPPVGGPGSAYNVMAVAALAPDTTNPPYNAAADFSNAGPNDFYNPVTRQTIPGVRAGVSIAAPGSDLILPAYIGTTGANGACPTWDPTAFAASDLNQLYFQGAAGTSFASPMVAGGAALLVDAGYATLGGGHAVDGRVIKAVLLNSARKTPGWNNNTVNDHGVLRTSQSLDYAVGAGALDLNRAYDQYLSGTHDVPGLGGGNVLPLGWDYGHVTAGTSNDYFITTPLHGGDKLTATLDWFVARYFSPTATADPAATDFNYSDADLHDLYFNELDLQLWRVINGQLTDLVADASSPYNNFAHLYLDVPEDGLYALRVNWVGITYTLTPADPLADDYALAWSLTPAPEPATAALLGPTMILLLRRRR